MIKTYMIMKMLVPLIAIAFFPVISSAQAPVTSKEVKASQANVPGNRSRPDKRWDKMGIFGDYTPDQEILEKRSRTTKHFLNGDGTATAQIMPGGIHYQDVHGAWQDIDMTIAINPDVHHPYQYVNLTNEVKSFFPGTAGDAPIKLQKETQLSFEWWKNPKYYHKDGNTMRQYLPQPQAASVSSDGKSLTYPGIYPDITEEFVVVNGGVENNTIIHALSPDIASLSANGRIEFSQFIPLKNGWQVRGDNGLVYHNNFEAGNFSIGIPGTRENINFGEIIVFDHHLNKDEAFYIMGLPAEKRSAQQQLLIHKHIYRGSYKVSFVQGGIEVSSSIGAKWLQSPDRTFPVTIDPTVTIGTTTGGSTSFCTLVHLYGYQRNAELYLQSEIGIYGNITAIEYYKNSTAAARTKPTKVWMRSTPSVTVPAAPGVAWNSTTYTGGLSTLFDGNTTQDNTTGWKMITLTTPFNYTADNLMIMVKSDYGGSGSSQGIAGNQNISNRSAALNQDYTDPPETDFAGSLSTLYKLSNIRITYTSSVPVTCAAPTAPTATAVTATTASLNWTQTGTPAQWQIKYGPAGFNVNTAGTSVFTPTKPYTLNPPLTPVTAYSYYVRAICGPNDTSAWSVVTNFTTLCVPPTIVSKMDSFNCGPGAVVLKATASAGGSIKWYAALTGGTALFTGDVFTTPSLTANTTYYITAASGTCESTPRQAVVASIRPVPVVNIGNDTTICPGITYTMDAGNPGASYSWNTGATTQSVTAGAAGSYSVQVTLNSCSATDTRLITAGIVPQNNLAATLDLCAGTTATLDAGNSGSSFLWTPGGQTTQTINVTTGGVKSVAIKSTTGCMINSSTTVTLRPLPVVNLGNDTAFCLGNNLLLDAGNTGAGFLWNTGATSQTLTVNTTGNYSVLVTGAYACKGRDTISIVVKSAPAGTINAIYGDTATYTFNIINAQFISGYTWDFGDGSPQATGAQVQHRYTSNGIFTVSVKLDGDCNDSLLLSRTVDVFDGQGTGILNQEEAGGLLLYPNPATARITVGNRNTTWKPGLYRIANALGITMLTGKFTGSTQHISVASLVPGIYFIHILTDKGFVIRKFEVLK